jgi:hypothetical protein
MLNTGFKTGDKIIAVDGEKLPNLTIPHWKSLQKVVLIGGNHKNAYWFYRSIVDFEKTTIWWNQDCSQWRFRDRCEYLVIT